MPINLNEAAEYREMGSMIPDGTYCWVSGKIRRDQKEPYSLPGFDPADNGIFKKGNSENGTYFTDWEFTVTFGPHTGSKIWQNLTITGGMVDDKGQSRAGNITKSFYRGMVESAFSIMPSDKSQQAMNYRNIPSLVSLENIPFAVKIGIEAGGSNPRGGSYPDKNYIFKIILPDDPEYAALKAGQVIPPAPMGIKPARGGTGPAAAGATGDQPLWQQQANAGPQPAPAPAQQQLPVAAMPAAVPVAQPQPAPQTAAQAWAAPVAGPAINGQAGPVMAQPGSQPAAVAAPVAGPAAGEGPAWLHNQ